MQPTRDSNDASSVSSLLGLAPGWGYLAADITADAGGLLHRLFTMTALRRLFISVALSGKLPRPGVSPVPCSVECGLSSTRRRSARPRPSSRPEAFLSYLFLKHASIICKRTIRAFSKDGFGDLVVSGADHQISKILFSFALVSEAETGGEQLSDSEKAVSGQLGIIWV
jgi:hypothetical protein